VILAYRRLFLNTGGIIETTAARPPSG